MKNNKIIKNNIKAMKLMRLTIVLMLTLTMLLFTIIAVSTSAITSRVWCCVLYGYAVTEGLVIIAFDKTIDDMEMELIDEKKKERKEKKKE